VNKLSSLRKYSEIGSRLRKLRLRQQLTLDEVAQRCGFTRSLLSKIETGKAIPPLATLDNIANHLGVRISHLLGDQPAHATVFTPAAALRGQLTRTEKGYSFFAFATQRAEKLMQPFLFEARRGQVKPQRLAHRGEEFVYVLAGRMRYRVGATDYTLGAGDSLYFDSETPHDLEALTATVRYLACFMDPVADSARR